MQTKTNNVLAAQYPHCSSDVTTIFSLIMHNTNHAGEQNSTTLATGSERLLKPHSLKQGILKGGRCVYMPSLNGLWRKVQLKAHSCELIQEEQSACVDFYQWVRALRNNTLTCGCFVCFFTCQRQRVHQHTSLSWLPAQAHIGYDWTKAHMFSLPSQCLIGSC